MMKRVLFITLSILCTCYALAQNKAEIIPQDTTLTTPKISFANKLYNFGKIRQGEKITTSFFFKNTGTQPLVILQIQTSCGCTASEWTKEAIAPNSTGEITVTFDTTVKKNMLGKQEKYLLVISNAKNKEEKLALLGEVVKAGNE